MSVIVTQPFLIFYDRSGQPLDAGYIYIGLPGINPEVAPITVYWDSSLTTTAAQPIRTLAGYPSRNGSPSNLVVNQSPYSIVVRDSTGALVYSNLNASINSLGVQYFQTYAELTALGGGSLADGAIYEVAGRTVADDGGEGTWRYDSTSTATANGGTILAIDGGGAGRFFRLASGPYFPEWFGAARGGADAATAIQACADAAETAQTAWEFGPYTYGIGSTITLTGQNLRGQPETVIVPLITDGSAVFYWASGIIDAIENIYVNDTSLNAANYLAGTASAKNCTAFKLAGVGSGVFATRFYMRNVKARGVAIGYDIRGFIITAENVWVTYSDLGLKGDVLNSADLNLRMENNKKDFTVTASNGVLFRQLIAEGAHTAAIASTLDDCSSVQFLAPYWEQATSPRLGAYLKIGGATICYSVEIDAMRITDTLAAGIPALEIDNCEGLAITGRYSGTNYREMIKTTANTVNYKLDIVAPSSPFIQDDSKQIGIAENYFPNPNFDLWFRGWYDVAPVRATISQETTLVRKGKYALKVLSTAGQANNHVQFTLKGPDVTYLRGKMIRVGAWVYTPSIAAYPNSGSRTILPGLVLSSFNGSVVVSSTTNNTGATSGKWSFWVGEVAIQSDATDIFLAIYANNSATNADGTEYIVIDSVTICEVTVPASRQIMGDLRDSDMIYSKGVAGLMIAADTAAPTDVDQTYVIGDRVIKSNVAAAGSPGWICTTAGAGGTAVFKAEAAVAA
jgi:hypothetical protein